MDRARVASVSYVVTSDLEGQPQATQVSSPRNSRFSEPSGRGPLEKEMSPKFLSWISYELPSTVKAITQGSIATCSIAGIATALFATAEVGLLLLLNYNNMELEQRNSHGHQALIMLTFASLIFNASATISSIILIDKFGELPSRSAWKASRQDIAFAQYNPIPSNTRAILTAYGADRFLILIQWHWLLNLIVGCLCICTQIVLYTWLQHSLWIAVCATCFVAWGLIPLGLILLPLQAVQA